MNVINWRNVSYTKPSSSARVVASQAGFSLIELMVAIAIGLLLTIALIALFLNVNRTNEEMAKTNSQIENGRFTIQLLQDDISHAGFLGTFAPQFDDLTYTAAPTDAPTAIPDPCLVYSTSAPWTASHKTNLIGIPVQVYGGTPPSGTGCATALATNQKADTDVLVVRHIETCVPGETNCEADTAGKLYFQSSLCETEISAGSSYVLDTTGFTTLHKRDCTTVAEKRKFISNIYYIRDYATTEGDGIPTLMLSQFDLAGGALKHQAAVPLIEGVEGFKVELGVDSISDNNDNIITNADATLLYTAAINWLNPENLTSPRNRGDGVPDAFVHCDGTTPCTVEQLTHVTAVKLYVLARADKVSPGYNDTKTYTLGTTTLGPYEDGYKRHVFSTTIRLNNVAARRETP